MISIIFTFYIIWNWEWISLGRIRIYYFLKKVYLLNGSSKEVAQDHSCICLCFLFSFGSGKNNKKRENVIFFFFFNNFFSSYLQNSVLFSFRFYLSSERFRDSLLRNLKPGMIPLANSWRGIQMELRSSISDRVADPSKSRPIKKAIKRLAASIPPPPPQNNSNLADKKESKEKKYIEE